MFITSICNDISQTHISGTWQMRTHEWPQFVQDVVEHHDIDTMDEYIGICCRNSLQKKNAWPGMCKWSPVTWHPTGFTTHNAIGEKSDFSLNSIHHNTHHEMIWWPLQSKWSTCQCSSNTRSNYRHLASHAQ